MKKTAIAPANIAFVKYWGKTNEKLRLPANSSFAMTLDACTTTTTVEFSSHYQTDSFTFLGESVSLAEKQRVFQFLNHFRRLAKKKLFARVVSQNSFPKSAGLASSASGFAALALAAASALNLKLSEKQLSILARLGSGSACRSIPAGFVKWQKGKTNQNSYAYSVYPPHYWALCDILLVVSYQKKLSSSTAGQQISQKTSPFYQTRLKQAEVLLAQLEKAFSTKNFVQLGQIIEQDCLNFHAVALTSSPALFYWSPETLAVIKKVYQWRQNGLPVYFTIDAGPNVHLICEAKNKKAVLTKVKKLKEVKKIIVNQPSRGAFLTNKHLF